jgi:hypothetical protein
MSTAPVNSTASSPKSNALRWILGGSAALIGLFALAIWLMFKFTGFLMATMPIRLDPADLPHYAESEARLKAAATPYDRWLALGYAGMWALHQGRVDDAGALGAELLDGVAKYPGDWNVGNAIHKGNILLGRVALRRGDLDEAKSRLLAAGRTPGSPQLDSFGPNMALAEELLQRGEKQVVLEYFDLCESSGSLIEARWPVGGLWCATTNCLALAHIWSTDLRLLANIRSQFTFSRKSCSIGGAGQWNPTGPSGSALRNCTTKGSVDARSVSGVPSAATTPSLIR